MIQKCPGADNFNRPKPEEIKCPGCGYMVEIWTDEIRVECPKCTMTICRKLKQSCVDWCKYAEQCIGVQKLKEYKDSKSKSAEG